MPQPKNNPFSIKALADNSVEIFIYGDIGDSWDDESTTAAQFVKDLAGLGSTDITLRINSPGGSVTDGLAIYNALKRHPAKVTTEIDGIAASIASLIAMAGDTVNMASNALFMIHAPGVSAWATPRTCATWPTPWTSSQERWPKPTPMAPASPPKSSWR